MVFGNTMKSNFWCRMDHVPGVKMISDTLFLKVKTGWVPAEPIRTLKNSSREVRELTFELDVSLSAALSSRFLM